MILKVFLVFTIHTKIYLKVAKNFTEKKLMSCFAHTLYKNKWLVETDVNTHNSAVIAKKFYSLFGWDYFAKDKNQFDYHIEVDNFDIQSQVK